MEKLQPILSHLDNLAPLYIAGPCSAESRDQILRTADGVRQAGARVFRAGIWKPRTLPGGFEGVGSVGLEWLLEVKQTTGMAVATEVATAQHVREAMQHEVDILWIGARTSANPFAVQEIADTITTIGADKVAVLVKNPVNPDLELWVGALQRLYNAGVHRLGAIHRGFSVYGQHLYRNLPLWRIPLELARRFPTLPLICDPSHIGGRADLVNTLSRQAMDMGYDGLIIESHCAPQQALSDSRQQITPHQLATLLSGLNVRTHRQPDDSLKNMRDEIDRLDAELLDVLGRRMQLSREIAQYKKEKHIPIFQAERYDHIMTDRISSARRLNMSDDFTRNLMSAIHEESVRQQLTIYNKPH